MKVIIKNIYESFVRLINHVIFKNFTALSFLQISNYIFPLITLPYLVRILGPEKYGLVNLTIAFISYFNILTDFGFAYSANHEISINRDNKPKVESILSSILTIKTILLIISTMIFLILIFIVPFFKKDFNAYLIAILILAGNTYSSNWFFQGMERMKYITYINFSAKLIFTILIFLIIHTQSDFISLIGLNGLFSIGISIGGILLITKKFGYRLVFPKLDEIIFQFNEGKLIFVSNIGISLYAISNTFLLGLFTNNIIVGYYSAADKLRTAMQALLSPLSQSLYPRFAFLFKNSFNEAVLLVKKIYFIISILGILIGTFTIIYSKELVIYILGINYLPSIPIIRIMAFVPLIVGISNLSGIQVLLNLNEKGNFMRIILVAALINLILLFILIPIDKAIGAAYSMLITEIFVTSILSLFAYKKIALLRK
jgi:PST family polysaccharide transporter